MTLVDTHAHLDFAKFDADRPAVIERAKAAGVTTIINVGADLASSQRAVELAEQYDVVYAAVGVHPHDALKLDGAALGELRELAKQPKVVALGEIGLDFYRDLSPRDVQRRAFQAQLAWAAKLGRPVIVHDRDAHDEIMEILDDWAAALSNSPLAGRLGVLHTFSGDLSMAERAMDLGFYISISGPVTYKNARELPEIVQALPLERLLVETDCPFLTPHPYRGKRNEPAYVRLVAERIAELRGMSFDALALATTANARRLFELANIEAEEEVY
ncbi:MAG TPA: TatD family hydrolase [Anaerolineae bacterium]|nr:TatD family hydrolase [Anaerolineae bacterium]